MTESRYPLQNPIVLIRGLPGSGKSTLGLSLARQHNLIFLESNMFFETEEGYMHDRSEVPLAHAWVRRAVERSIHRRGVVLTGVFATVSSFGFFKRLTTDFTVIECTDEFGSPHDVSEESLNFMKSAWQPYADAIRYSYMKVPQS